MLKSLAFALSALLLSGCATEAQWVTLPGVDRYAAAETKFEGQSTVYVLRGKGMSYPLEVKLDQAKVGWIHQRGYIYFAAHGGVNELRIDCPLDCTLPNIKTNVDLKAGKTYYFLVESDLHSVGYGVLATLGVRPIDPSQAAGLLATYSSNVPGK